MNVRQLVEAKVPSRMGKREFSDLRKFVTGSGKQSRFVGQPTGTFQPVRSGIKFSPAAEQAISASLEPLFAQLLKSGKITSNIYGPEHANSFTRKFVSAAIKAVEEERNR